MPKTELAPAAAVFSEGFLADELFEIGYGLYAGPKGKALNVDSTPYDRLRVDFYQVTGVDFFILAYSAPDR